MIVLDATIVNVALPTIQDDLGFSQSKLAWVVNAYMIPFGGLLLLAGRIGDLVGQRRVFLAGLTVFTAASLLCAASQSQEMLIGARFVQGIGGALASAVILGMIVTMFPEPASRRKRSASSASSPPPAARSGCCSAASSPRRSAGTGSSSSTCRSASSSPSWRCAWSSQPRGDRPARRRRLPRRRADHGLADARRLHDPADHRVRLGRRQDARRSAPSRPALLAAFVHRQATIANPLMPLRLFRSRNVAGANVVQALIVAGMFGMFFLGALYLQRVLGYSALEVGLAFLPTTIVMGTLSLGFSEKLIMRFGPRRR